MGTHKKKQVELDDIKYARCKCGRSYPLASFVPPTKAFAGKNRPADTYEAHQNTMCQPCLRSNGAETEA